MLHWMLKMELRLKIGERANQFVWYETAKEASTLNMLPKKETDMMEYTRWICLERLFAVIPLGNFQVTSYFVVCFLEDFHFQY